MTTLVCSASVNAGCFWRSMLTHLRLDTFSCWESSAKWVSKADTQSLQLHRVLCNTCLMPVPCVLGTIYLNLWHHQQSPCQPASTLKGTLSPSGNQSMCYTQHKKLAGKYHLIMVVWLTNTLLVVEGVYKTSIADHIQPFWLGLASHPPQSTLLKLQPWSTDPSFVYWLNTFFVFASSLCDIINVAAFCFDEVRETMLLRSPSTTSTTTTIRTTPASMVTTMTWRALSSTADARGASVRLNEYYMLYCAAQRLHHDDIWHYIDHNLAQLITVS